jgi:hypothetical protein
MDLITFTTTKDKGVRITINNRDLREIIRLVELPFATQEGSPDLAGAYVGLPPDVVFQPSRHLLGKPDPLYCEDRSRVHVLGCECGEPGCWPLSVRIDIRDDLVVWQEFQQPHRGPQSRAGSWRFDSLAAFRFERGQYEQALLGDGKGPPSPAPNNKD